MWYGYEACAVCGIGYEAVVLSTKLIRFVGVCSICKKFLHVILVLLLHR